MTYEQALNVLDGMNSGVLTESGTFNEAVDVIFSKAKKLTYLEKRVGQMQTSIRNKNRIIRTLQKELEDNQ